MLETTLQQSFWSASQTCHFQLLDSDLHIVKTLLKVQWQIPSWNMTLQLCCFSELKRSSLDSKCWWKNDNLLFTHQFDPFWIWFSMSSVPTFTTQHNTMILLKTTVTMHQWSICAVSAHAAKFQHCGTNGTWVSNGMAVVGNFWTRQFSCNSECSDSCYGRPHTQEHNWHDQAAFWKVILNCRSAKLHTREIAKMFLYFSCLISFIFKQKNTNLSF